MMMPIGDGDSCSCGGWARICSAAAVAALAAAGAGGTGAAFAPASACGALPTSGEGAGGAGGAGISATAGSVCAGSVCAGSVCAGSAGAAQCSHLGPARLPPRRRHRQHAGIEPHRELPLLLLIRIIDQVAKLGDQLRCAGVGSFSVLNRQLVLAVAETHDLHEPPARLVIAPVRPDLLVNLKIVAPELVEQLAESPHQARVFGSLFLGDDVTVGLQKHRL